MTRDEPRALVAIPLAGAAVTSWRMPRVGEPLEGAWGSRYFRDAPRRFRVTSLEGASPQGWRVVAEATDRAPGRDER